VSVYDYDPEVPAGYQDADIEQAEFEAAGRRLAALRRRGICTHGWRLGRRVPACYTAADIEQMRRQGNFPERPTDPRVSDQASIPEGLDLCTHCGELVGEW
jgi:hypothetical protein